ncbi:MAG: permease-like cell division protein FtsX [Bacteroidota bacterium]
MQNYLRRKSRGSYITTTLSISLVLFILGVFASIAIFGNSFARQAQDSVVLKIEMMDGIKSSRLDEFEMLLKRKDFVQSYKYVSKDEALEGWMLKTQDKVEALGGTNPFPATFDVKLQPEYIATDSLDKIREEMIEDNLVAEVHYPMERIFKMNQNIKTLTWIFLGVGILMIAVVFYLIFGTIRLSIYAQRLGIRTMQLIGASEGFIRKPFLLKGLMQGLASASIAGILITLSYQLLRWFLQGMIPQEGPLFSPGFIGLLGGIMLFGLLLGFSGSYFAVNRYMNRNLDELMLYG